MIDLDAAYFKKELYVSPVLEFPKASFNAKKIKNIIFRSKVIEFVEEMEKHYSPENLQIRILRISRISHPEGKRTPIPDPPYTVCSNTRRSPRL